MTNQQQQQMNIRSFCGDNKDNKEVNKDVNIS